MKGYYKGNLKDKYCALCGSKVEKVKCYSGIYSRATGKPKIDVLVVCDNKGCFGYRLDDLMRVKQ